MSPNLSSSSSLKKHKIAKTSITERVIKMKHKHSCIIYAEDSDEELLMVPDMEAVRSSTEHGACNVTNPEAQKRRRGRNPVDKEYRRLKRLLRNRVSAQQARERKKVYVSDLETRARELQDTNAQLEEKISTLMNENTMLRKVLINASPKQ